MTLVLATAGFAITGDVNFDGNVDPLDQLGIQNHVLGIAPLEGLALYAADANIDSVVDGADILQLGFVFPVLSSSSPANFEEGVSVTRETILRFSRALNPATVNAASIFASFGGQTIPSHFNISPDGHTVTLFYDPMLPASARVRVTVNGDLLQSDQGLLVDADGDGLPGGTRLIDFDTLSLTSFPGTTVTGRVFASELVAGDGNTTASLNLPLEGVRISVAGADSEIFALTDAQGNFHLDNAPAGRFFVHIDGRVVSSAIVGGETVQTHYPAGPYFPFVGKAWTPVPGHEVSIGDVFLPLILPGTLQDTAADHDVTVGFAPAVLANNPGLAGVSVTVPADSLYSDSGARGGKVGIAPVPPDRIPGPLPAGLEFPLVITVQTDGPSNFDVPAPACFPNLPDPGTGQPLPPGTKNYLYSFNHDKGVWEPVGPMTVSEDGTLICTDAGTGIKQPGWHGSGPVPIEPPPPCDNCCFPPSQLGGSSGGMGGIVRMAESPAAKCKRRCFEDEQICLAAVSASAAAAAAVCAATVEVPPAAVICIAGVVAAGLIGDLACFATAVRCQSRCDEDNCPGGGAGTAVLGAPVEIDDPVVEQITQIIRQMIAVLAPGVAANNLSVEALAEAKALVQQANTLAGGDAAAYLRQNQLQAEVAALPLQGEGGEAPGNAPPYSVRYLAEVRRPSGVLMLRGETEPFGQYSLFIPRDGTVTYVSFYDPRERTYGLIVPHVRAAQFQLPRFWLNPVNETYPDFDGDGLPDAVEFVYGTSTSDPDSDHDGIPDGAEVEQGTNPLDGLPAITGVIASADTPGTAKDVFALNDLAVVADGEAGVSVFNVFNGLEPRIIAQVDTPGDARRAVLSGRFVVVADGPGGLEIIDIIDPPAAHILHQITTGRIGADVLSVAVAGDVAYAGLASGDLVAVDLIRGVEIGRTFTGDKVQDLAFNGDTLLAALGVELKAYDVRRPKPRLLGAYSGLSYFAEGLTGSRRLFAGGGQAYVTGYPGYDVFDVSDPAAITRLGFPPTSNGVPNSFKQIVLNGSGLGLAAVGTVPGGPVHDVSLFDTSEPTTTTAFLTLFETPGKARAVSIYNGKVFAADSEAGLQVINYLPYDAQGTSPTIGLAASFALDPGSAEEGSIGRITADVTDDVQVRNVEFYINGELAVRDGSFPFEHRFRIAKSKLGATFKVRARATDTGGNAADSPEFTITIIPDQTPPVVDAVSPEDGLFVRELSEISATFSESLDPATVAGAAFSLISAGPDLALDTGDDFAITTTTLSYNDSVHSAFLTPAAGLAPGLYQATVTPPLADLDGNPLSAPFSWSFFVFGDLDADGDGVPDILEPELGLIPGNQDSDGDTIPDGLEDFDGDGLPNQTEFLVGTDPRVIDTDGDGTSDEDEDFDGDDLTNAQELALGTNVVLEDTDADGWPDGTEIQGGSDPLIPTSIPVKSIASSPIGLGVVVPRLDGADSLPYNTVGSQPGTGVLVPRLDGPDSLPYNTVGSLPPVDVEYAPGPERRGQ